MLRVAATLCIVLCACTSYQPVSPAKPGARTVSVGEGIWGELGDKGSGDGGVGVVITAGAAVRHRLFVGGRLAALPEFKIQIFESSEPEETGALVDIGPVVGLCAGSGRLAAMATAGPMLTWIDVERDGEYEQLWRPGLGADAGFTVRLFGHLGVGLAATVNVNPERPVIGGLLRLQGSWLP